ncbi:hypothetical protein D9M72_140830 [compost metagenome]
MGISFAAGCVGKVTDEWNLQARRATRLPGKSVLWSSTPFEPNKYCPAKSRYRPVCLSSQSG